MRKLLVCAPLLIVLLACSKHDEKAIVTPSINYKPAFKLYFSEFAYSDVGYMYIDTLNKYFLLATYDSGLASPNGIAYNRASDRLYITSNDDSKIFRLTIGQKGMKEVYDSDHGVSTPTCVAIDTLSKKLYWANAGDGTLRVGDLYGTTKSIPLYDSTQVVDYCYGIAIDHKNNKIYFGDNNLKKISVGNLDGTGTPTVLYPSTFENMGCPQSLVLIESTLYWADDCNSKIVSAGIDGKGPIAVLFDSDTDGLSLPNGIAVDKASNKIYWSDVDLYNIYRGNLDGSGSPEIILENQIQANSISLQFK